MTAHRHFHYHASAHALSGELTRPVQRMIEVQAGTTLPTTGGVGSSRVENFRVDEVVSFRVGYGHVSGSVKEEGDKKTYTTHATATVEGLNILDVVAADRIVARASSSYQDPPPERPVPYEGRVLLVGSKFENLTIAGYQVDVELDHKLLSLEPGTFAEVRQSFGQGGTLRVVAEEALSARGINRPLPHVITPEGRLLCSIVKEVHFKEPGFCCTEDKDKKRDKFLPPGVTRVGRHVYDVVDFGRIFLAEVLCQHGRKTLTMLRVELGSPNGGGVLTNQVDSNGWPPWG